MTVPARVDGRVLRGERTRATLVDALLSLFADGVTRPRAQDVADRAGVSLRTVFQHFDDLHALHAAVVAEQAERLRPLVEGLSHDGTLDERVDALALHRTRLYTAVAPVRAALDDAARTSAAVADGMQQLTVALRRQLRSHFATEIERGGRDLLLAVEAATSYDTWSHLRRQQRASAAAATATMAVLVRGALHQLIEGTAPAPPSALTCR